MTRLHRNVRLPVVLSILANIVACNSSDSHTSTEGSSGRPASTVGGTASTAGGATATVGGAASTAGGATATVGGAASTAGGATATVGGAATAIGGMGAMAGTPASGGNGGRGGGTARGGTDNSAGASSSALVNPAPGSKAFVGVNFWRIDWEGAADFFLPNVNWATVTNPWQPQLLSDLAPFSVLRFMDWNLTNDDPNPQSVWSTRKLPTQSQTSEPIAFEWQLDLCNRALMDCWITVPIQANATFQSDLAQLAYDLLDPRLRLYVEYSNEVWNGGFPQADTALATANRLNL